MRTASTSQTTPSSGNLCHRPLIAAISGCESSTARGSLRSNDDGNADAARCRTYAIEVSGAPPFSAPITLVLMRPIGLYSAAGTDSDGLRCAFESFSVAYDADEIPHLRRIKHLEHFELLELVA
jgi:hypothetical protein